MNLEIKYENANSVKQSSQLFEAVHSRLVRSVREFDARKW
jgi:hypothetical protein